jgi:hypothetical protein
MHAAALIRPIIGYTTVTDNPVTIGKTSTLTGFIVGYRAVGDRSVTVTQPSATSGRDMVVTDNAIVNWATAIVYSTTLTTGQVVGYRAIGNRGA